MRAALVTSTKRGGSRRLGILTFRSYLINNNVFVSLSASQSLQYRSASGGGHHGGMVHTVEECC